MQTFNISMKIGKIRFLSFLLYIWTLCVSHGLLQSAAREQGAEGHGGRAPVCSGGRSPPCGCSGDLPEKCWAQPRRGSETQRGAAKRRSAVPHQTATSSHLMVIFWLTSTWICDSVNLNSAIFTWTSYVILSTSSGALDRFYLSPVWSTK